MSVLESSANSNSPADRYLRLWRAGQPAPDLDSFLAECPDLPGRLLADVLLVDQAFRWQRGDRHRVEDYLRAFPEISSDQDLVVDLVYGEWRVRSREQARSLFDEYLTRFPYVTDRLADQVHLLDWLTISVYGESS